MEVSARSFVEKRIWIAPLMEALAVETVLAAGKCLVWLLKVAESLLTDFNHSLSLNFTRMDGRFPLDELVRRKHAFIECKDASDEDDDDDDQDEEDANDQDDDDAGDEDFSGEGEEEADPEDDPEANGAGGSDDGEEDDDEDGDEDDDEDGEEVDEEEEEEEEEADEDDDEVPQPPAKRRK